MEETYGNRDNKTNHVFISCWEELSLFMTEAGDRILNVLSIRSFSLIFFLKGKITQDRSGLVSIHVVQLFLGYFIFAVYKLSHLKWLITS